ncbi:galacturan 1,4-alpha-galacturonidase B [Xylogone sp. PMI_703]|nr:galacturan 1,4-alpha-galacturonidase B [Xylogone sp. PMI_703]
MLISQFLFPFLCLAVVGRAKRTCVVPAKGSETIDDAPAILNAFDKCGRGGRVLFQNTTYHINSVMNISSLKDCEIDLRGTLLWGTNITYWLNNSFPVGYQNQSTAWILGGDNIVFDGHDYGTINGNGDAWYNYIGGASNYPRRPHALTIANTTGLTFRGVRFIRSQMWTLSIIYTKNALFDSIYVNNTASAGGHGINTDGADTIYSSHITFNNWVVDNGDDGISMKANSTDIYMSNIVLYHGSGLAMGSIGQYNGVYETIERVYAKNITCYNTLHAVYFKTWTGEQVGFPPNGGGGGLGIASDLVFEDMKVADLRGPPLSISQCTTFSGASGNCTSSEFLLSDLTFGSISGTTQSTANVASFQCSAVEPCRNIKITNVDLTVESSGAEADQYLCGNVQNPEGWNCTGQVCVGPSGSGGC